MIACTCPTWARCSPRTTSRWRTCSARAPKVRRERPARAVRDGGLDDLSVFARRIAALLQQ
jgi:hypothetical protein